MNNPKHSMADVMGMEVGYLGQNGVKQHLFGSPPPLVTHVFTTLDEAVERFGARIKIDDRPYKLSLNFKQGYESAMYSPRPNADRVERLEYAFGHLKRLVERAEAKKVANKPKPVDMRLPHEVLADKVKAEKAVAPKVITTGDAPPPPDVITTGGQSVTLTAPTQEVMSKSIASIAKRRRPPEPKPAPSTAPKPAEMEIGDGEV